MLYALGHRLYGHEFDSYKPSRVLYNCNAKNLSGIVVSGKAWGSLDKISGGSYATALRRPRKTTKYIRIRALVRIAFAEIAIT